MKKPFLTLYAPLSGKTVDLSEVPDEVFASGMAGDGLAIRPTSNVLKSPCAAKVINLHRCGHAITLRALDSCDILIHIGLDTVNFNGQGFTPKVKVGDEVKTGSELIEFDLDFLRQKAKSTLTEIILTSTEKAQIQPVLDKNVTVGEDTVAYIYLSENSAESTKELYGDEIISSWDITVKAKDGLHARPAAKIADTAKKFTAEVNLVKGNEKANGKSMVSIMSLNIKGGDKVRFEASGKDAAEALYALMPLLENSEAENPKPKESLSVTNNNIIKENKNDSNLGFLRGTGASKGTAAGLSRVYKNMSAKFAEESDNPEKEAEKLLAALGQAKAQLTDLRQKNVSGNEAEIFSAHQELLSDDVLLDEAFDIINSGKTAAFAWNSVTEKQAEKLLKLDNPLLAGRAADLKDVGSRVLAVLCGQPQKMFLPDDVILIAKDITPSMVAEWVEKKPCGFACVLGSATSHASILASSLGIPAVVGLPESILSIPDNTKVILDGTKGTFAIAENEKQMQEALLKRDKEQTATAAAAKKSFLSAKTKDGRRIEVGGNISGIDDARRAMQNGADGCGLLRTEFVFLNRQKSPDEQEQADIYIQIAKAVGNDKRMIVRTLDIGGDKNVPFISMQKEENPFLGIRGIRLSFANLDLFRTQIRAVLRSAEFTNLHIMFPMISSLSEFKKAKQIVLEEKSDLGIKAKVKIGLMVEVPSAALLTDAFVKEADFFSIGTNDLTQYVLAADRGNSALNEQADALHPAVLKLIKMTVDMAHKENKFVGVCGGLAGDETAVPVLVGLGVDELSVSSSLVPEIKEAVRQVDFDKAGQMVLKVLEMTDAKEVRAFLSEKNRTEN